MGTRGRRQHAGREPRGGGRRAFTTIFLELGDEALAGHETLKGAYYLRLAEFFLFTQDPRRLILDWMESFDTIQRSAND